MRIGHGYDVHRTDPSRDMFIGGVKIDCGFGLLGHSDADVLLHAIMDALLGAAALGDIGRHFPDFSDEYKDISSLVLLDRVRALLSDAGCEIVNVDATLVLQKPRVAPYIEEMRDNIARTLLIEKDRVNVKATTEEHLGFTGREEGISAQAVAMIKK